MFTLDIERNNMKEIKKLSEEIQEKVDEIRCLTQCFYRLFEDDVISEDSDYYLLLPLAKIISQKSSELLRDYDIFDDKIYKKAYVKLL